MLPFSNSVSRGLSLTIDCAQLDVLNPNASDSATHVDIDKGAGVFETFDVADTLVFEGPGRV